MTIEERFNRIEYFTSAEAEQRRKDGEENRQLWRDTERQIAETNAAITRLAEESRAADARLGARIDALAEESREADARLGRRIDDLGSRIDDLISGMGQFIAKFQPKE